MTQQAAVLDQGLVVSSHGRHYLVETPEGRRLICHPRGKKSECVVGDQVLWKIAGDEGVIEQVQPRRNLLFRQDEWKTKAFAANLDQILVMVASAPVFSESQLARALIAAESAGIKAQVLLNKADLPGIDAARQRLRPYQQMGDGLLELSMTGRPQEARDTLTSLLAGKTTLVLGPSGTGKSTLINLMAPEAKAQVNEISHALNSGRHTTTTTQWYWLDNERTTALIDSPGFQQFGLKHIGAQQLISFMPDLLKHTPQCKFYNCTHQREPSCGVQAAVQQGEIGETRYRIYCEILQELTQTRW